MKVHAPSVSRKLRADFGIVTVPDYTRSGYRVTGGVLGTVTIACQFDIEATAERKARDLEDAIRERWDGYTVERRGATLTVGRAQ
ncbi:helix-turn-helix DNA binding domain protein [Gordonia phage Catfish]|uniref:Helix-turn-helix DNA binding domain protein n=1 Tax=Gordonia phage Catfish TaxID=2301538 RepID=A0A385D0L3_9CAUD|nr:helix-turn-helix DNA binding domain protein [Gordonia phage Catfish]AXQ51868.1 helix-turn-helix DNA-binding domain protein [Gordonia phage Catfish]